MTKVLLFIIDVTERKKLNFIDRIDDALDRARELLNLPKHGQSEDFVSVVTRETVDSSQYTFPNSPKKLP